MRTYVDASAFTKLLVTEEGSDIADEVWERADRLVSSRLLYAEARASLASARRSKRIAEHACGVAHRELERRWQDLTVVEIDDELTRAAGHVSDVFGLCTGDAIHLASALELGDPGLVVATWDGELRRAALDAGLAVCP